MARYKWWKEPQFASEFPEAKAATLEATGAGPDGKVVPGRPKAITSTTQGDMMLHEGEVKMTTSDGRFAVIPSHLLGPEALSQMEKQAKMGGFASGGTGTNLVQPIIKDPFVPGKTKSDNTVQGSVVPNFSATVKTNDPGISQVGSSSQLSTIPVLSPTVSTTAPSTTIKPIQAASTATKTPTTTSTTSSDLDTANSVIKNYATGQGPYIQAISNKTMQDAGATGAAGTAAMKQELAMSGANQDVMQTAAAVRARDVDSSNANLQAQIAQTAMSTQLSAAGTMATNAQWLQQFQETQKQNAIQTAEWEKTYGSNEALRAANDVATGMTWQTFSAMHPTVSKDDYNGMKSQQQLGNVTNQYNALMAEMNGFISTGQIDKAKEAYQKMQGSDYASINKSLIEPDWNYVAKNNGVVTADKMVDNYVAQGMIPKEYLNPDGTVPDQLKKELLNDFQNAYNTGAVDSKGNYTGKSFALPWNDPATMYEYVDWNGKEVKAGTDLSSSQYLGTVVDNTDNGTKYQNSSGSKVTFGDMKTKWDNMSVTEQQKYIVDGKIDTKSLLGTFTPVNGNAVLSVNDLKTKYLQGGTYSKNVDSVISQLGDSTFAYTKPDGTYADNALGSGTNASLSASDMNVIYQQFNEYLNKNTDGSDLSAQQFNTLWNKGKSWVVDSNGSVLNFTQQSKYGTNASGNYEWDGKTGISSDSDIAANVDSWWGFKDQGANIPSSSKLNDAGLNWGKQMAENKTPITIGDKTITLTKNQVGGGSSTDEGGFNFVDQNNKAGFMWAGYDNGQKVIAVRYDDGTGFQEYAIQNGKLVPLTKKA